MAYFHGFSWLDESTWPDDREGSFIFFARAVLKVCQARHPKIQWTGELFHQGMRPPNPLPEKLDRSVAYYDLARAHRLLTASDDYPDPSPLPPEYASPDERQAMEAWRAQNLVDLENHQNYRRRITYGGLDKDTPISKTIFAPKAGPRPRLTERPLPFSDNEWRWAREIVAQAQEMADKVEAGRKAVRIEIEDAVINEALTLNLRTDQELIPTRKLEPADWIGGQHSECFKRCWIEDVATDRTMTSTYRTLMWVYADAKSLETLVAGSSNNSVPAPEFEQLFRELVTASPHKKTHTKEQVLDEARARGIDVDTPSTRELNRRRQTVLEEFDDEARKIWSATGSQKKADAP